MSAAETFKARAKKSGPESCEGCKQPIHAKEKQAERGSQRVHVSCLALGRSGVDPRKPGPLVEALRDLASVGTEQAEKAGSDW